MNNFEEKLKNVLESNQLDYQESYWQNMSELMDKKGNKKKTIYRVLLFSTIIGLSSFYFISQYKTATRFTMANKYTMTNKLIQPENGLLNDNAKQAPVSDAISNKQPEINIEKKQFYYQIKNQNRAMKSNPYNTKPIVFESNKEVLPLISIHEPIQVENDMIGLNKINLLKLNTPMILPTIDAVFIELKKKQMLHKEKFTHIISPYFTYNFNKKPDYSDQELLYIKTNEQFKNTYAYGVNYLIQKKKLVGGIGISINKIKINTNYLTKHVLYHYDTTLILLNPNHGKSLGGSNIALLFKDVDTTITESLKQLNPNNELKLSYLQIPLFTQYHFAVKKVNLYCELGYNFMIASKTKGDYVIKKGGAYEIVNQQDMNGFSKLTSSYRLGFGVQYPLMNKVGLFTSYHYQTWLNSTVKSYTQKPIQNAFTLGLKIGL